MPHIEFCPQCGTSVSIAEDFQGSEVVCGQCGQAFAPNERLREVLARVTQRLTAMEQRLEQMEGKAKPTPAPTSVPLPPQPRPVQPRPQPRRTADIPFAIPVEDLTEPAPRMRAALEQLSQPQPAPLPTPARKGGLEQTIGLKWAGWVGAIVLVIGIGLGIKYAYDQGWFGFLSYEMRLVLMSLGGFALIGAGEYVYRRVNRVSAAALFGAGVATLFLVSYAGNVYYQLYSYEIAFIFVALTTMIGAAIAMRGRLVTIAILAHIGGNLAPYILSTGQKPDVPFYSYLYMLQVVALILALWGHSPEWWALRVLALATTSFWVLMSLFEGAGQRGVADELLWFGLLYAFTFQGELLRSSLRIAHTVGEAPLRPTAKAGLSGGAVFSTFVTAGVTALLLYLLQDESEYLRGSCVLALAALALAGGFLLPVREGVSVQALAIVYRVQGIALVILSVPVFLTGVWISLAWMILSLTFGVLAARLSRTDARVAGFVTWCLALLAWLIELAVARPDQGAREIWLTLLDEPIHAWTVLAWLLAAAGQLLAWLLHTDLVNEERRFDQRWSAVGIFICVLGSLLLTVVTLVELPPLGATLVLILWAWLLAGFDFVPNRLALTVQAFVVLLLAAVKWAVVDALATRLAADWSATEYLPLWNPLMGLGLLLAASLGALAWLRRDALQRGLGLLKTVEVAPFAFAVVVLVALVVTFGLSVEVDRLLERAAAEQVDLVWPLGHLRGLCFTILWTLVVLAVAWAGRQLGVAPALPWVLLILLAGKFLVADTLAPRLDAGTPTLVPILLNIQALAGFVVAAGFVALRFLAPLDRQSPDNARVLGMLSAGLGVLIGLWIGTLEIDRAFSSGIAEGLSDLGVANAKMGAISIFWSLYALAAVAVGFRLRAAWLRYFGLGLFAVTLFKVGVFDLSQVKTGYRILSSIGLGLLLLGTSVLYGKLSPILLGEEWNETTEAQRTQRREEEGEAASQ